MFISEINNSSIEDKLEEIRNNLGNLLAKASEAGNIEEIKTALIEGADINYKDDKEKTALMYAIKNNRRSAAEFLIKRGANLSELFIEGVYEKKYYKIIKSLVKNSHDINLKNQDGDTILISISKVDYTPDNLNFVKFLLKNNANVNIRNNEGDTALIINALGNYYEDKINNIQGHEERFFHEIHIFKEKVDTIIKKLYITINSKNKNAVIEIKNSNI